LLGWIEGTFNLAELKGLAFGMGVDWDALPGDTLNGKAIGLIEWCEHRSRVNELRNALLQARPKLRN